MTDQQLVDRLASIQGIRPATAQKVADAYGAADQLAEATPDELTEIKGIGAVTAARIVEEFSAPATPPTATADPDEAAEPEATVTELDARRETAQGEASAAEDDPVEHLRLAARAVTDGASAVVDTVKAHLPEVKDNLSKAAGAVAELGREVKNAVLRRAS